MFDDQAEFRERFEWGEAGIRRLAPHADVLVVVDVLSFATAVDVAVGRDATIYPYRWRGATAESFARKVGAILAADRTRRDVSAPYSLSPHSLRTIPKGTRLVLPSPNGATLVLLAAELCQIVLAGCLRNATAVATACRELGGTVAVIAAGERWLDAESESGTLRPAVEDLVGAGAILTALHPLRPSPEAIAAIAAFHAAATDLSGFLNACSSGRELRERGFIPDVDLAAQIDVSQSVPRLSEGAFERQAKSPPNPN